MSAWPPPPDLASIKELVRDADVEGLIEIHGAPSDEYDTEAETLHTAIAHLATSEITAGQTATDTRNNSGARISC